MERNKYLPEIKVQARMPQQWRGNIEMKKQEGESENNYIERMTRLSQRRNQAVKNVNQAQHQAAKQIFDVAKQPAYFVPVVGNAVLAGDVAGQVLNKDYTGAATTLGTVGALKYGTPYLIKGTQKAVRSAKNTFDKGIHVGNYYANIPKNSNYAYRIMRDIEAQDVLNGQPLRLGRTNPAKAASDNAAIAKERATKKGPILYKAGAEHGGRKQFAKGMPWGGTTVTNGEPVVLRIKGNGLDWKPGKHFKGNRTNLTFESAPVGSHIDLQANPETGLTTVVPSQMEGSELFYKNKLFGKNFGYKRVKVGNSRLSELGHEPYQSVGRSGMDSPVRSSPIMDVFRFQLPTFKTGDLGRGHYYRVIGGEKGLQDAIENGFRGKNPYYIKHGHTYWAEDEPFREYTSHGPLMVSYDKNGPYQFGRGNFDNPISASGDIKFNDPNIRLYGRYPFTSKYVEIPKNAKGINFAKRLSKSNKYVEKPVKTAAKGYVAYKLYDYMNDETDEKKQRH